MIAPGSIVEQRGTASVMMRERKTLKEFRHELNLSRDRHLIVEGNSDRVFYTAWLEAHGCSMGVAVQVVGAIEVDEGSVRSLGLPDAERSRVIALAEASEGYSEKLLCIVDRDTGVGTDRFQYASLAWTDFPALESYVMHPKIFRLVHALFLQGKVGEVELLYQELATALYSLWRIRKQFPSMPAPNYKKGLKAGCGLAGFDAAAAVDKSFTPSEHQSESELPHDIRPFAYGHDIAKLLFAAHAGMLKNKLQFPSESALERAFCGLFIGAQEISVEPLFVRLRQWATNS